MMDDMFDDNGELIDNAMEVDGAEEAAAPEASQEAEEEETPSSPVASLQPPPSARVLWDIACSHNILPLLDRKLAGRSKSGEDKVPVCLLSTNTFYATEEQRALAQQAPVVRWLSNAPHLTGHNPFLFVVEGPAGSADPSSATEAIPATKFRLRPRFNAHGSLKEQVEEYDAMRVNDWSSPIKFEEYWTEIFERSFFKSIEAKAPILATSLNEGMDHSDRHQPGVRLEDVKRLMYLVMRSNYATYCANTVDEDTDKPKLPPKVFKAARKNKKTPLGKLSSKKRKRADVGADDVPDEELGDDLRSSMLREQLLTRYFGKEDAAAYGKKNHRDISSARHTLGKGSISMQGHYDVMYNSFREALAVTKQIVFSKAKKVSTARSKCMSYIVNSSKYLLGVPSGTEEPAAIDENSMDVDYDSNHPLPTVSKEAAEVVERIVSSGSLTCTEVARRLVDLWGRAYLRLRDSTIVEQYYKQHGMGGVSDRSATKRPTLLDDAISALTNRDSPDKLLVPFAVSFYFGPVALTPGILRFMEMAPCWALSLVRMWYNNSTALQYFNTSFVQFAEFTSAYDNISNSLAKSLLLFIQGLIETETPLTEGALELITKMEAGEAVSSSIFDMIYKSSREHTKSIATFLQSILAMSPDLVISNVRWFCATRVLSTLDSHYIRRLNTQVDRYTEKMAGTNERISPFIYHVPPPSVAKIANGVLLQNNPAQTIYFCLDENENGNVMLTPTSLDTQVMRGESEMAELSQSGFVSRAVASANSNNNLMIWACRRSHFIAWIEICDFIKTNRVVRLGDWGDYLGCRTAVDQSILMALIGLEHLGPLAQSNGLVIYIPLAIIMQLHTRLDTSRGCNDRWVSTWLKLAEKPYVIATMETLEAGLNTFPRHPHIYIVHAEAMTVDEWLAIKQVHSMPANVKRRKVMERQGDPPACIYTTFSPVLGGFSSANENFDGQNYNLFMDANNGLFVDEVVDIGDIKKSQSKSLWLPNSWMSSTRRTANGSSSSSSSNSRDDDYGAMSYEVARLFAFCRDLLMLGDADIAENPKAKYGERSKSIIDNTNALYFAPFNMPSSDYPTIVTGYLQAMRSNDNTLQYQTIGGPNLLPSDTPATPTPKSSRLRPVASAASAASATMATDDFDMDAELVTITPKKKKAEPAIKQYGIPLGLVMDQMSIPDYQIVQYCETHPRATTLHIIDMGDEAFLRVPPMRLANILARSRQHTYCLADGERTWKRYVSHWRKASSLDIVQVTRKPVPSIPIYAYAARGITPSSIQKMEDEMNGVKRVKKGKRRSIVEDDGDDSGGEDKGSAAAAAAEVSGDGDDCDEDEVQPHRPVASRSNGSESSPPPTRSPSVSNGSDFLPQDESTQAAWGMAMSPPPPHQGNGKKKIKLRVTTSSLSNSQNSPAIGFDEYSNASNQGSSQPAEKLATRSLFSSVFNQPNPQ